MLEISEQLNIPSLAAPKSGPFSPYIMLTKSLAYLFQVDKFKPVIWELNEFVRRILLT